MPTDQFDFPAPNFAKPLGNWLQVAANEGRRPDQPPHLGPEMAPRGGPGTYTGASGEKVIAPDYGKDRDMVRGVMAGVNYKVSPAQYDEMVMARKAGAGKNDIQAMVDRFSGTGSKWSPEKEAQYREYRRGGSFGRWRDDFESRIKEELKPVSDIGKK